jgi:hypothetical protein
MRPILFEAITSFLMGEQRRKISYGILGNMDQKYSSRYFYASIFFLSISSGTHLFWKGTWEDDLKLLIQNHSIETQFLPFPSHPPNNESLYIAHHAYRSDFTRMNALAQYGGIYLDTDAFVVKNMVKFVLSYELLII